MVLALFDKICFGLTKPVVFAYWLNIHRIVFFYLLHSYFGREIYSCISYLNAIVKAKVNFSLARTNKRVNPVWHWLIFSGLIN